MPRRPDWEARVAVTLAALRGLALTRTFAPGGRRRREPWPEANALVLGTLGPSP
jgi:hypothetical protein